MTIKIEIVAADQQELTTKLLTLAEALRMGANVQSGVKEAVQAKAAPVAVEAPEAEEEVVEEKAAAKNVKKASTDKPAAKSSSKKASGPSEETLREYIATAAAYLLNDAEEAPKLEELLEKFMAETLEDIATEDLENFSKEVFKLADDVFEGVPKVPTK